MRNILLVFLGAVCLTVFAVTVFDLRSVFADEEVSAGWQTSEPAAELPREIAIVPTARPEDDEQRNQEPATLAKLPAGFSADLVKVEKAARKLHLIKAGEVHATYAVSLGDNPIGHKQQEGDERTPEGRYVIDWRNPNSSYHLSLHISYPNEQDKARAKAQGVDPGGMIMIHGQPNGYEAVESMLQRFDWTDGCIAVTNDEMRQIWDSVANGTPIEIVP